MEERMSLLDKIKGILTIKNTNKQVESMEENEIPFMGKGK